MFASTGKGQETEEENSHLEKVLNLSPLKIHILTLIKVVVIVSTGKGQETSKSVIRYKSTNSL